MFFGKKYKNLLTDSIVYAIIKKEGNAVFYQNYGGA